MIAKCVPETIHRSIPIVVCRNSRNGILTNIRQKSQNSTKLKLLHQTERIYEITAGTDFILLSYGDTLPHTVFGVSLW